MSNAGKKSVVDVEFCSLCGTILPLPGDSEYVECYNEDCKNRVNIIEFDGVEMVSHLSFNKIQLKMNSSVETSGALVDRACSKCGNEKMSFTTRQTRSVDEGQTVFYLCPSCGNQETEHS